MDRFLSSRRASVKRTVALIARYALVFLLCAALTGPSLLLPGGKAATWALCDLSASAADDREALSAALTEGLAHQAEGLQTGAISFGANAMVDVPLAEEREQMSLSAAVDAGSTDIGGALAMALALLPQDAAGRIVLLSDGQNHGENLSARLTALQARGVAVDVYPLPGAETDDAQVSAVVTPAQVYQGERFEVTVQLDSRYDTKGTLVLYANRQPVATREVTLRKGSNTFAFEDVAAQSGVVTYEAELLAQGDANPRNNRLGAYMDVRGVPRVLVAGEGTELAAMLEASGMRADVVQPSKIPQSAEALRQYHAVALVNVAANEISQAAMDALDDYVRTLGRGLCAFGGDNSYALGGWRGSQLEDMLPVTMDVDNRLDMPSLALVLVIDKSGSMSDGQYGLTRLEMAKEAAIRACEVLTSRDSIGVVAFDDTAKWAVPMQKVENLSAIQEMIGTIRPGGGTMFFSALQQAFSALIQTEAQYKHIIFLTDGESGDSGFDALVQRMSSSGITLSTVAVGSGANSTLLSRLAELGNGRAYTAVAFDDLPTIFTKETMLVSQAYVQNRTFYPVVVSDSTLTRYDGFPTLDGYLATTAKPLATVALATDRDDPLLAWWQYGAGRTLAWTSDTRGAWTHGLLSWEEGAAFFAGMLSFVMPAEEGEGSAEIEREGDTLRLRYTVEGDAGGLQTEATALAPDGTEQTVSLSEISPGVYEGVLSASQEGAYAVRVSQRQNGETVRTLETGATVGYSREYDLRAADGSALLEEIAAQTGGRVLEDAAELFSLRGAQARARYDLTGALLWAALALFVLDAAQRRLAWERLLPQRRERAETPAPTPRSARPRRHKQPEPPKQAAPDTPSQTGEKLLAGRRKKLM